MSLGSPGAPNDDDADDQHHGDDDDDDFDDDDDDDDVDVRSRPNADHSLVLVSTLASVSVWPKPGGTKQIARTSEAKLGRNQADPDLWRLEKSQGRTFSICSASGGQFWAPGTDIEENHNISKVRENLRTSPKIFKASMRSAGIENITTSEISALSPCFYVRLDP